MRELLANLFLGFQNARDVFLARPGRRTRRGGLEQRQVGLDLPAHPLPQELADTGGTGRPGKGDGIAGSGGWTRQHTSAHGFTLIELLVVVAIIAILAGLLLPALSRGKAAARATECRNSLRTMALALHMYLGDFNAYPPTQGMGIMGFGEKYGWLMEDDWKMVLVPFVGVKDDRFTEREDTMRVLRCPQLVSNEDGKRGQGQYALNASGTAKFKDPANLGVGGFADGATWNVKPTRESRVRMPADLIAVGDITPGFTMGEMLWTSGHFDVCSTNPAMWPGTSHGGRANLLFADGHVETARQTNLLSIASRPRWNNDQQPHPETWARP